MGKIRRGGYVFIWWKGDHAPRHMHIYKDQRLIAKWDLEKWRLMKGTLSAPLKKILDTLVKDGLI